ncbi:MAG: beta strand repeat-containing protein, partial [Flavobacteriales bacterium]
MTIIYKSLAARLRFLSSVCGLALLTVLSTTGVVAQVGPPNGTSTVAGTALAGTTAYAFAQSSGTYTAITGGTVYQSAGTLNTDAVSSAVNIGFNFLYNNRTYSTVRISNNGFITFGANAPLTTTYTGLSSNVNPAYEGAIAGFAANLRASAVAGATPEIRYETLGASPNRTFVVQFQDVGVSTTATTQRLNFQIRISETTNVVQIVYGTTAWATATATGQVGLKGGESSDLSNRTGTTWTALTGGTGATSSCTLGTTGGTTVPASGLTFTWTPGSTWSAASYATLPFLQDFTTWTNALNTADVAGTNMRTWPSRGDVTWRASTNLVSGFTSTVGWGGTGGQTATYSGAAVAPGARFHSFDCSAGSYGDMDFYLDMSSSPIGLYNVQFLHNNPSGSDVIQVFYSGDAGATFTQVGSNIGQAGNNWNTFSSNTAGTATSVIRVRAIGDFGADDINIDNFRVTALTCASPSALLYTPSSATGGTLSWTNPTAGTPTNYEYEIRTSGAAGSGAAGLVTSGTIANPTNSAAISAGTLAANTAYSAYIRTDCGGGDLSGWSTATAFTTPCTPSVAPFSQTFATAYNLTPTGTPTCWREATGAINLSGNSTVTTGTNNWGSGNFANVAGNTGFKINLYGTNNAWVITEPITLGAGDWALGYSMAVTTYNATGAVADLGTHAVRVIVSTDFGTTWSSANIIKTYTGAAAYSTAGATEYVSLNSYAGQTIQVAFVATTSTTSPDIDFHLDNIAVIVPCSGTPVIGASAAAAPTTLGCSGSVVNLTMDAGAQLGAGVAYQWASSADGVTFNNISGATGSTYNTPAAVINSTYYRGTATCSFSGLTNTTADYFVEAGFPTPTVAAFPPLLCGTGGTSSLTATIIGANPYDTFVWDVGAGESGILTNQTSTTADWTIEQSAAYTYTVTDTTTGCARTVSQSINVLEIPTPIMTASPSIVCSGGTTTINSGLSAVNFSYIPIAPNPKSGNTVLSNDGIILVPLSSGSLDDGGWGNIPIGFSFNFFGTNYTNCNIGTNGTLLFGGFNSAALSDYTFTSLPNPTEPNPMIAALATDQIATSGIISYGTYGFPGNRVFVVEWNGVREYNNLNRSVYNTCIYEATGIIEVHITSSTVTRNKIIGVNGPGGWIGASAFSSTAPISSPFALRFLPPQNFTTSWTPASDINGTSSGTNLFSRVTNSITSPNVMFNLQLTNQQTGCTSNGSINVNVLEYGSACDDLDPCTVNDIILYDCSCAGTFSDADNDGICDANDNCPSVPCDDNNPCTINDIILADCSCFGTFADADNDGICDANDNCSDLPQSTLIPSDLTLSCDEPLPAFDPGFFMPDGSPVIVTQIDSVLSEGCNAQILQQWIGINSCNDRTVVSRIVTRVDEQAPVCSNPPAPLSGDCGFSIPPYFPLWSDNCDIDLSVSENITFQQNGCSTILTTVYTAIDDCGNISTVTRVVNLIDSTAPVASNVPASQTIECSSFSGTIDIGTPT